MDAYLHNRTLYCRESTVEINKDQPNEQKQKLLIQSFSKEVSHHHSWVWQSQSLAKSKAGRGVEKRKGFHPECKPLAGRKL